MAQTLRFVTAEAGSGEDEPRHETQILRLELGVPVASPERQRNLVCAGRVPASFLGPGYVWRVRTWRSNIISTRAGPCSPRLRY